MVVVNKSPLVRLHISLTGDIEQPQEVVRKVTEEDEEVEVDGFIFKRKRRRTQQETREEPLDEYEDTQQSHIPHPQPTCNEGHQSPPCIAPADTAALRAKAMDLLSVLEGFSDPQQVLPDFCEKFAQISLQEALIPEDIRERLAATWPAEVAEAVRCALSNGTLVCGIPTEAGTVKLSQHVDRESQRIRLAYLHTQVQRLRAEKEEWRRLAEEHSRMTEELESQVPAPSSQHLDVPSPSKETLALSQELATARQGAHQNVSLQIDGLCALVDGVEELVGRAEHQCSVLQARWHRDKFRKFPHVDSPARLIKDIIQPVPLS